MLEVIKKIVKEGVHLLGFDLVRLNQIPRYTFMGLKNLPINTIVDVGANEGQFAKEILKVFPDAIIYCFEPLPNVHQDLLHWVETTGDRVIAYNVAVGEKEDIVSMHYHVNHHYSSSLLKTTKANEEIFPIMERQSILSVKQITLDKWLENVSDLLNPDILIKLDVQGYEDRVIRGGMNLFKMARACILEINLDKLYDEQASFKDIFLLLDEIGYHYCGNFNQVYDNDGRAIWIDSLFAKNQ